MFTLFTAGGAVGGPDGLAQSPSGRANAAVVCGTQLHARIAHYKKLQLNGVIIDKLDAK